MSGRNMSSLLSVPNKTAVLPPLASKFPQWSRTGRLPSHSYSHADTKPASQELRKVSKKDLPGRVEGLSDPLLRVTQLEQNIRFLQEQHQLMLSSLHHEVDMLRQRNRDLQFQLVFTTKVNTLSHQSSADSSPDDDGNKHKVLLSPKQYNARSLQVEILEREVTELRNALADATSKNTALTTLVEQQNMQLEAAHQETAGAESEMDARLDDADRLIRRLRRENEDQRRELAVIRGNMNKGGGGAGRHGNGRRGGSGGVGGGSRDEQHRFPPLHSQSYWHQAQQRPRPTPNGPQSRIAGEIRSSHQRKERGTEVVGVAAPTLPHVGRQCSQPQPSNGNNGRARYYSNANHYYSSQHGSQVVEGEDRKCRGGRGSSSANEKSQ